MMLTSWCLCLTIALTASALVYMREFAGLRLGLIETDGFVPKSTAISLKGGEDIQRPAMASLHIDQSGWPRVAFNAFVYVFLCSPNTVPQRVAHNQNNVLLHDFSRIPSVDLVFAVPFLHNSALPESFLHHVLYYSSNQELIQIVETLPEFESFSVVAVNLEGMLPPVVQTTLCPVQLSKEFEEEYSNYSSSVSSSESSYSESTSSSSSLIQSPLHSPLREEHSAPNINKLQPWTNLFSSFPLEKGRRVRSEDSYEEEEKARARAMLSMTNERKLKKDKIRVPKDMLFSFQAPAFNPNGEVQPRRQSNNEIIIPPNGTELNASSTKISVLRRSSLESAWGKYCFHFTYRDVKDDQK